MTNDLPILYKEARTGKLHSWQIWNEDSDLVEEYGTVDGAKTINRRTAVSKNTGKANETTPQEQAVIEAKAKHKKKLDKGYSISKEGAKEVVFLPMLAHDYNKLKKPINFPVDTQPKIDGVRCMAFWSADGETIKLMSRGGKEYYIPHIATEIAGFLPPGFVLDGEIYLHGIPLQDINALVKKHREPGDEKYPYGSISLEYWIYDGFDEECAYYTWDRRRDDLYKLLGSQQFQNLILIPSWPCQSEEKLFQYLKEYLEDGYEGAIIRLHDGEYSLGHRSRSLLKLKNFIDAEFEIVGWYEAKGNDKGTVCWTCITPEGKEFRVRPTGTRKRRAAFLAKADSYIGKQLTVKFQQYSKDKVPTGNTVGVAIREEGT